MMRTAIWGALLVAGLCGAGLGVSLGWAPAHAQIPAGSRPLGRGALIALTSEGPEGFQQLTVIDAEQRVVGVYHVERSSGRISLKSVRNVHWDLQMDEFNGLTPSPREIQLLLRQQH